jgi:hypothetical protein
MAPRYPKFADLCRRRTLLAALGAGALAACNAAAAEGPSRPDLRAADAGKLAPEPPQRLGGKPMPQEMPPKRTPPPPPPQPKKP